MAIKLVVDSASDISLEEANKLNITLLPFEVRFKEEVYFDGVDLLPNQFYEKLIENDELPKTSLIIPYRFEETFEKLVNEDDQVLCICISSKLSGTYNNALQASKNYKGKVFVIDSLNVAMGERLLIEYALRLINENKSIEEIVSLLNEKKSKINVIAMLDTLKYLKKGGRISPLVAFSGDLLSIKPVIGVINGEVKLVGKARGSKNRNNLLNKLIENKGGVDFSMPYAVGYSGFSREILDKYIKDSYHLWQNEADKIPAYQIGCTIGTHIGPNGIGLAFFEK